MTIEITTPRLILRTPTLADGPMIVAAMKEVWHELQKWMSWAHDGADTIESLRGHFLAKAEDDGSLIGLCRTSGRFVVSTGINRMGRPGVFETGYWVAQEFLRQGYASEATNAAIRYGFDELGAKLVEIRYYEGNEPSRRIIEKLGFTKTIVRPKAKARCLDGTLLDVHEFEMADPLVLPPLNVSWRPQCP